MTENPQLPIRRPAGSLPVGAIRSDQDVVFVDVGSRKIESQVTRNGIPVGVHKVDPDVLKRIVIGEPVIPYRIVSQSIAPGTAVPLGTTVDVVLARGGALPVDLVEGVHRALHGTTMADAYTRLVAGKPLALRLVARAAEGPLNAADEQAVRDLFQQADLPIDDTPGQDVEAGLETLRVLTAFVEA